MLEHPLNINFLLNKTLSIKNKILKKKKIFFKNKIKVYVLNGSTSKKLIDILEIFLLNYGILPEFKFSEFDRYYETALFKKQEIIDFKPDIIYIHTSFFNLKFLNNSIDNTQDFKEALKKEFDIFRSIWEALDDLNCTIIQNNFEFPYFRANGNFDAITLNGKTNYVLQINKLFAEHSLKNQKLLINDINYLSALYGLESWYDYRLWFSYKYAFSFKVLPYVSYSLFSLIKLTIGDSKKALITDLDNTLWGGIIGEEGFENIKLGNEDAISESFLEVQNFIKKLSDLGIILGINSKNDYKKAIKGFKNKNSILKEKDFSIIKANWLPKNINMQEIIKFLNIAEDQIVYIDDSKFEREIIKKNFKKMSVPNVKNPEEAINFILFLDRNYYFQKNTFTKEDKNRNVNFQQIKKWQNKKKNYHNYEDFLNKMKMTSKIYRYDEKIFERIFQLINKTNQFNLLKSRVLSPELKKQLKSKETIFICADLIDKFVNYGITNIIIGNIEKKICKINHWVMSCRVFDRTFENFIFNKFVEVCNNKKINKIIAKFIFSEKNIKFKNIYYDLGFNLLNKNDKYSKWELDLKKFNKLKTAINKN